MALRERLRIQRLNETNGIREMVNCQVGKTERKELTVSCLPPEPAAAFSTSPSSVVDALLSGELSVSSLKLPTNISNALNTVNEKTDTENAKGYAPLCLQLRDIMFRNNSALEYTKGHYLK